MAAATVPDRRTLLVASAALAAASVLPPVAAAAEHLTRGSVSVFEPDDPAARAFARDRGAALAVEGDRIRFARRLFGEQRPTKVVGMTRYADFLMLADSAREHGYRATLGTPGAPGGGALFVWTAERA